MTEKKNAILFKDLFVAIGDVIILENVSARVPLGSCTTIIGPNGAGKTTLLLALLGHIPYSGTISINTSSGSDTKIGYLPQILDFDRNMPLTVLEFFAMAVQRKPIWFGVSKIKSAQILELLSSVKAEHLINRRVGALSGGELQRILLALALQHSPDLLILDEPMAGVDLKGGYQLCELLDTLRKQHGFTQLMITHDIATVLAHGEHVIILNKTVLAEGVTSKVMSKENVTSIMGTHVDKLMLHLPVGCCD